MSRQAQSFTTRGVKEALLFVTPSWKADRAMELVYLPLTWTRGRDTEEGNAFVETWQAAQNVCTLYVPSYPVLRNWNVPAWRVCPRNDRFQSFSTRKIIFSIQPRNLSWNSVTIQRFNANIHIFPTNLINIPLLNIFIFRVQIWCCWKKEKRLDKQIILKFLRFVF